METPKPEESSEETSKESSAEAETISAVEQEVIKSVPKLYKTGARQLLDKIKEHRDVLHWNDKGELVYENKPISGSHMVDLVNDMLRHRKGFEPGLVSDCEGSGPNECTRKYCAQPPEAKCYSRI